MPHIRRSSRRSSSRAFVSLALALVGITRCGGQVNADPRGSMGGTTSSPAPVVSASHGPPQGTSTDAQGGAGGAQGSGLRPISLNDLEFLEANACAGSRFAASGGPDSGVSTPDCQFAIPQVPAPCTGVPIDPSLDMIEFVFDTGNGESFLVANTEVDCPLGDGYSLDGGSRQLALCEKTCRGFQGNPLAFVEIIAHCRDVLCVE